MSITNTLKAEHQLILQYIDLMEQYANHDAKDIQSATNSLLLSNADTLLKFIYEFADTFHHAKEENVLFKYLSAPDVLTQCNPVQVMLAEHHQARDLVNQMQNAVSQHNIAALIASVHGYANLLRSHIYKEDNILYPMAERSISDQAKVNLLTEYEKIDEQRDAQAITSKYQNLLLTLQSKINR